MRAGAARARPPLLPTVVLAICGWAGLAPALQAQFVDRAREPWLTLETPHFRYLFPRPLTPWAQPVVARFEAVRGTVDALVGYAPPARVTVVMDDPVTISNGLTVPELQTPVILFLATPPGPRTEIGDNPDWGEILSVHEYAHAAHLTRPSRNPWARLTESLPLLPLDFGPIARHAPRWAIEGYATYVEGRLTGSGRPHGVWRAAVLRQWALEGRLPSYAGMSGVGGYRGGSMAYLAGSAYLEWLVQQRGDSALPHVWRRLTARSRRSFPAAFAGVFGRAPDDLYDRFRVELTGRALAVRAALAVAGLAEGDTIQSLAWQTGDPALSADGAHMAIVLRARDFPSRVVVWRTAPEPDTARARLQARALARDPEDVPAVRTGPPAKRPLATLWPAAGGRAYDQPRFLPDGEHILLTRFEALADGSVRPDLVIWDWKHGGVRRVTHGAATVSADPFPDGRSAAAVRCLWGRCDLVRVDLGTGAVRLLAAGAPAVVYARPRVSRDGQRIAVAVQRAGRWQVEVLDAEGGSARVVGPDDAAQRYDPAFLPGRSELVVTSEEGGIPNLEVLDPATAGARPITRVTGAAMAPEPAPDGSVYFLRLHARGLDLARVPAGAHIGPTVALDPALAPAAPPAPAPGQAFAAGALPTARGYGLGPRQLRLVPSLGIAGGGIAGRMALFGSDPVGRLDWLAQGAFGHELWQGGSLRLIYRRILPQPQADLFATIHHPGQIGAAGEVNGLPARVRYDGGGAGLGARGATSAGAYRLVLGGSVGALTLDSVRSTRALGWLDLARSTTWTAGPMDIGAALAVTGAAGRTAGVAWSRLLVRGRLYAAPPGPTPGVELRGARGAEWGAVDFERFAVGGEEPPLFEPGILSQQVAMPALPEGSLVGPQVTVVEGRVLLNGVTAYLWGGSASQSPVWQWVAGLEQDVDTPPVPLLRLPGVHAIVGLGYTLNEKPHRVLRLYGTATLRP